MIKVKLHGKKISQGRESLFLDFWPPVRLPDGKETRREFLGLYVFSKPRTEQQREHNRHTQSLAETIWIERQLEIQNHAYALKRQASNVKLGDFFEKEAAKRIPQTANQWGYMIRHLCFSGLYDLMLAELDVRVCVMFREYLQSLLVNGKLKANTAANYFSYFRTGVRAAYRQDLLTENLIERFDRLPEGKSVREYLTLDELNRLAATPIKNEHIRRLALFAALSGLRTCDLRALKWSNVIEHDDGAVSLYYRQQKTKTDERLPISRQARSLLGQRDGDEQVFPYVPWHSVLNETIGVWVKRAGINKHITMHCFRHTYATLQLSAGTDIFTVSKLLGHSSVKTTQIYAKVLDETKRQAAERVMINSLGFP